jgi:hypothetical protein
MAVGAYSKAGLYLYRSSSPSPDSIPQQQLQQPPPTLI